MAQGVTYNFLRLPKGAGKKNLVFFADAYAKGEGGWSTIPPQKNASFFLKIKKCIEYSEKMNMQKGYSLKTWKFS